MLRVRADHSFFSFQHLGHNHQSPTWRIITLSALHAQHFDEQFATDFVSSVGWIAEIVVELFLVDFFELGTETSNLIGKREALVVRNMSTIANDLVAIVGDLKNSDELCSNRLGSLLSLCSQVLGRGDHFDQVLDRWIHGSLHGVCPKATSDVYSPW